MNFEKSDTLAPLNKEVRDALNGRRQTDPDDVRVDIAFQPKKE